MSIVCFGDSLTYGKVGYSYIHFMRTKEKVKNHGVNGDTTIGVFRRFKRYIEQPRHNSDQTYVIAIGTNDLLLPYLTQVSALWKLQMQSRVKMKHCILDAAQFKEEYEKYISLIQFHHKKMIAVGIPQIELQNFPMDQVKQRNQIIEQLCVQYHIPFVNPADLQVKLYEQKTTQQLQDPSGNQTKSAISWKHKNLLRVLDAVLMLIFPFTKDWLSKIRHLTFTVDGVHYNSGSAKLIAEAIEEYL